MKMIIFFFSILFLGFSSHSPEVFKIDLDLPPQERFKDVLFAKQNEIKYFSEMVLGALPQELVSSIKKLESKIENQHKEFYEELLGVAKYTNLTFSEAFSLNLTYEILASCTSIVSIDKWGNVIHGRNLDYSYGEYISKFIVHFEFYKNGLLFYEGDGNAGFLGLVTGLKKKAFAISLNQRESDNNPALLINAVKNKKAIPIPYFIRNVLEQAENYENAIRMLSDEEFAAPCYLIISGIEKNEGAVITRDRHGVYNISQIDLNTNQWFLVQTNSDRDIDNLEDDIRRVAAENRIDKIGRSNMTMEILFNDVISLSPNKNSGTITSSVMSPKTGFFNTTIWED